MLRTRRLSPWPLPSALLLAVVLGGACDDPPAKAPDAKAAANPGDAAVPHAVDPAHGMAPPHPMPPHGAMGPMAGPPPTPMGPPRDVTPSGETTAQNVPGLTYAVPKEWEPGTPSNTMRLAQYVLPGPGGDAELVVFRFPGGGGSVEANLTRWKGQFAPPEGQTIDDVSSTRTLEGEGMKTTLLDVRGMYTNTMSPTDSGKQMSRMLAAIVEASGPPYFFKATGPVATIDLWAPAIETMIGSFAVGGEAAPAEGGAAAPAEGGAAPAGEGAEKAEAAKPAEGG